MNGFALQLKVCILVGYFLARAVRKENMWMDAKFWPCLRGNQVLVSILVFSTISHVPPSLRRVKLIEIH